MNIRESYKRPYETCLQLYYRSISPTPDTTPIRWASAQTHFHRCGINNLPFAGRSTVLIRKTHPEFRRIEEESRGSFKIRRGSIGDGRIQEHIAGPSRQLIFGNERPNRLTKTGRLLLRTRTKISLVSSYSIANVAIESHHRSTWRKAEAGKIGRKLCAQSTSRFLPKNRSESIFYDCTDTSIEQH